MIHRSHAQLLFFALVGVCALVALYELFLA